MSWRRIAALTLKEARQVFRDPSSVAIGIVFPLMMIVLFGYGLSLDVSRVSVAVVDEDPTPDATSLVGAFQLSRYFHVSEAASMAAAMALVVDRKADGIVRIPSDFTRRWRRGDASVQVVVNGSDANQARIIGTYVQATVGIWGAGRGAGAGSAGPVVLVDRMWFNESYDSHFFLVPGLIVLVMTVIGAFLTAMVISREWERGTLEALFVTPVKVGEILISKIVPYFCLGMVGFLLCLLAGKFLFHVPIRGSLALLCLSSMVYLLVCLGIGLLVSTVVKSQFLASQLAMLLTFLPAMMLSGFLYDPRSMPVAIRAITTVMPARYAVGLMQTLFLAGNIPAVVVPGLAVLAGMAALLLTLTRIATRKRLD